MYITADTYTRDKLIKMEVWIFATLELRLVFRVVGMVMGTSTVVFMPLPFPYGSDGDSTPKSVGFRLSWMSLSPSVRTRVGSGEAGSLSVDWCSWGNIRRGIHGSTPEHRDGLCAVGFRIPRSPGSHRF